MTANGRLVCQPEETDFDWCALLQMCFGLRSFSIRLSPVTACLYALFHVGARPDLHVAYVFGQT